MTLDTTDDPRGALWAELEEMAQEEARHGDGRAVSVLRRLRARLEHKAPTTRPPHQDDGA